MEFKCEKECSQCCIERHYYPSKKFGKVGVLILPSEKKAIEELAQKMGLKITILPRIGISFEESIEPQKILAYQLMGVQENGNLCPFLDMHSKKSPHGGHACRIYQQRPAACKAYPLIETEPFILDKNCKFCQLGKIADCGLEQETEALMEIKNAMATKAPIIWRYATGIGETEDKDEMVAGWVRQ